MKKTTNTIPEMIAFYEQRTKTHIALVSANLHRLAKVTNYGNELAERATIHDDSKFGPEEYIPYVWLTEFYRCRRLKLPFEYPAGVKNQVDLAVKHHMEENRHHADFHDDPNDMTEVDLVEMVCDWTAMAQEFKGAKASAKDWADKTIGKRIQFSPKNAAFIYDMIVLLDKQVALENA